MDNKQKITIRIDTVIMEMIRREAKIEKSSIQQFINELLSKNIKNKIYNKDNFELITGIKNRSIKGNNSELIEESRKMMK